MTALLWTASALLGALSLLVLVGNVAGLVAAWRADRSFSAIPLISAVSGAAACFVCPWPGSSVFALAFAVADVTVPLLVWAIVRGAFSSGD